MPELPPLEELSEETIQLIRDGECPSEGSDRDCSGSRSQEEQSDDAASHQTDPRSDVDSDGLTEPHGEDDDL